MSEFSHLDELEAEADLYYSRGCRRMKKPVMLYSIGMTVL